MRKSILRFGALALMSAVSIGAFAQSAGDKITLTGTADAGTYLVLADGISLRLTEAVGASSSYVFPKVTYTSGSSSYDVLGEFRSQTGKIFKVTEIDEEAFTGTVTSSVEIPATVTTIGKNAFSWVNSSACTIEFQHIEYVTSIGEGAFMKKDATTKDQSGATKNRNAGAAITIKANTGNEFVLSSSALKQLGNYAFAGVTFSANATKVLLGGIQEIPNGLFSGASNIGTVDFSDTGATGTGLKIVGNEAFKNVTITDFGYKDNDGKYYLPKNLVKVGDGAFYGTSITNFLFSVTNKGQISDVGASAFEGCTWLDNAHFCNLFPADLGVTTDGGDYVTVKPFEFGNLAFANTGISGCYDFQKVSGDTFSNAFSQNTNLKVVILYPNTKTIAASALQGCTQLIKCDLPSGLKKIDALAFQNTNAFTSVFIPSSVEFIGENAFSRQNEAETSEGKKVEDRIIKIQPKENIYGGNTAISVVINSYKWDSNSKKNVATAPIADYTKTKVYVPMGLRGKYVGNVTGQYAWNIPAANLYTYGKKLKAYKAADDTNPAVDADVFYNGEFKYEVAKDWDPQYSVCSDEAPQVNLIGICTWTSYTKTQGGTSNNSEYNTSKPGEKYTNKFLGNVLDLRQTVVKGGENNSDKEFVYYSLVGISDGLFNDPVKPDGADHFNDYYDLKENVETVNIQADALDLTDRFSGVMVNNEYTGIKALKNVSFRAINTDNTKGWANTSGSKPKTVTLGTNAFLNCKALSQFDINDVITTNQVVGDNAFKNCTSLAKVRIPSNVIHIGQFAYYNTAIEEVALPVDLNNISAYSFAGTKLTEINIPSSVVKIEHHAFDGGSEPVKNAQGITIDGKFIGVADVYVNWATAPSTGIDPLAFGDATSVECGTQPKYILRSLYTPDGSTYANAPFNDGKMFVISEAIVAKGGEYNGRIDVTLNRETNYRELNITDESQMTEFKITKPAENILVNYTRKVPNSMNMPNPLFVPFAFHGKGEGYQIYKVFDTKIVDNEDGTVSESIEYVKLGEDELTLPNVPYIFIPTKDEITFQAVGYKATTDQTTLYNNSIVTCSDAAKNFAFYGTYEDTAVKEVWNNGKYALSSGNRFAPLTWREDDPTTGVNEKKHESVKALRFYMAITPKNDPYAPAPANVKVIILDEDEVTAIQNVKASSLNAPMFDLMGRQITAPAKGQVYIQNGVKKLAK